MTWAKDMPQGNESCKIRWSLVPYMNGRVLDLGCGAYKTLPHFIGVDNGRDQKVYGLQHRADVLVDTCEDLSIFAAGSCDTVFSSHLLEHIPYENVPKTMTEWARVVKSGGHICLYLPDADEYPKCGSEYANPDHKWDVDYDKVIAAMDKVPRGWDCVEFEKRNKTDEYSLWFVFRLQ